MYDSKEVKCSLKHADLLLNNQLYYNQIKSFTWRGFNDKDWMVRTC